MWRIYGSESWSESESGFWAGSEIGSWGWIGSQYFSSQLHELHFPPDATTAIIITVTISNTTPPIINPSFNLFLYHTFFHI